MDKIAVLIPCYNEEAKIRLMEWNISGDKIKVVPQAYY